MTPSTDKVKTVPADRRIQEGRRNKAIQFLNVSDIARELSDDDEIADAAVTLYVHAGIAAADSICALNLGKQAKGSDHNAAAVLLASVDRKLADSLRTLLGMKTRAGYGHDPISTENLKKAQRTATLLVDAARAEK